MNTLQAKGLVSTNTHEVLGTYKIKTHKTTSHMSFIVSLQGTENWIKNKHYRKPIFVDIAILNNYTTSL